MIVELWPVYKHDQVTCPFFPNGSIFFSVIHSFMFNLFCHGEYGVGLHLDLVLELPLISSTYNNIYK